MEENTTRWSKNWKFTIAVLSYAMGMHSTRKGSVLFLRSSARILTFVPLLVTTVFITTPLVFMELSLGQYSGKAALKVWNLSPILKGVGVASSMNLFLFQVYNIVWSSYALYYTFLPFTMNRDNSWTTCNQSWARVNCFTPHTNYSQRLYCYQTRSVEECNNMTWYATSEMFWIFHVVNIKSDNWSLGILNYEAIVYGFLTTVLVALANLKSTRTLEPVLVLIMVTLSTFMLILVFVTLLHPGSILGLREFIKVDHQELLSLNSWTLHPCTYITFTGVGFGMFITLGSECDFRNSIHLNAIGVTVAEAMFIFFHGVSLYALIGIIEYSTRVPFSHSVVRKESTLFSVIIEAYTYYPGPPDLWIFMFYLYTFLSGYRSQTICVCGSMDIIYGCLPRLRRHHGFCVMGWCLFIFTCSVIFYSQSGHPLLKLVERALLTELVPLVISVQAAGVMYIYGIKKFWDDSSFMLGIKPPTLFILSYIVLPVVLFAFVVLGIKTFRDSLAKYKFLYHAAVPNLLLWLTISIIFGYAIYFLIQFSAKKMGRNPLRPALNWGPRNPELTKSRQMFTAHSMTKEYIYRQQKFKKLLESRQAVV